MSLEPGACERLAASRERLRQALQQVHSHDAAGSPAQGLLGGLLGHLQDVPGGGLMADVLQAWWQKQPLRLAWLLAAQTAKALLQPVALRHPYALVLGAAAAGGVLVLVRPWRWFSTPALLAGWVPQILSEAMKLLAPKPITASRPPDDAPRPH